MPSYTHLAYRRNAKAAARKQQIKKPKNQEALLKAREDFGYEPTVRIWEGLERTVEWWDLKDE